MTAVCSEVRCVTTIRQHTKQNMNDLTEVKCRRVSCTGYNIDSSVVRQCQTQALAREFVRFTKGAMSSMPKLRSTWYAKNARHPMSSWFSRATLKLPWTKCSYPLWHVFTTTAYLVVILWQWQAAAPWEQTLKSPQLLSIRDVPDENTEHPDDPLADRLYAAMTLEV